MYISLSIRLSVAPNGRQDVSKRQTRRNILVDICRSREVGGVAADVDGRRVLVDTDVVDAQRSREREVVEVDGAEVRGHPQVRDEVLQSKGGVSARG